MFDLTLTFDNGPEPGVTPRVLEILRERGIKATFFIGSSRLRRAQRNQWPKLRSATPGCYVLQLVWGVRACWLSDSRPRSRSWRSG